MIKAKPTSRAIHAMVIPSQSPAIPILALKQRTSANGRPMIT